MRYYFDTEFIEDGKTIDLISIGIVCEDERDLYLQSVDFDANKANDWVIENVLTQLVECVFGSKHDHYELLRDGENAKCTNILCPWRTRKQIAQEVLQFVGSGINPEFWTYFGAYDWVVLCQLFGIMMDLPDHFPMFHLDIKQEAYLMGVHDLSTLVPQGHLKCLSCSKAYPIKPLHGEPCVVCLHCGVQLIKAGEHHALSDARWNKLAHAYLEEMKAEKERK